ncbi:membrane protein insertase YidC [Pseudoxanthomonas indica]|uniref:Membrane protein insertase YidC n=1 Tax=Pseudoxanthomonas indica TaxID=428993 RepID=A0A1T5KNJ1_9GAMM|nr:membrane protein insertase YidC [Pseudoxanthomonas indica]GGD50182.1 membrane protein insertase YidC [Pseudoxanthomonas indica]SKC64848.1 protein translocase subunit yidC [Pseudoxanthomonas indica]
MNQTRVFLIVAWLMVAVLLWMEWGRFNAPTAPAVATQTTATTPVAAQAGSVPNLPSASSLPQAPSQALQPSSSATTPVGQNARVVVSSDVLRLTLDGGSVLEAELLQFPQDKSNASTPVKLFTQDPAHYYVAQSGWLATGANKQAPTHLHGFVPEAGNEFALAAGADEVVVPFIWRGDDGLAIRRSFILKRGDYALTVRDDVMNAGSSPWQGMVYRQLQRKPPLVKTGMTNPESFSFNGATWYDNGYQRRKFNDDFLDDGRIEKQVTGGWIAMLQHHFFTAWIPLAQDATTISLGEQNTATGKLPLINEVGPGVNVGPGQQATTSARLWVGPKLVSKIKAENVPGLDRAVDYSQFAIFAIIGQGLFWLLSHLHSLFGNWGWSIIGLVVLVKLALYPLAAKQYKSMAKMRQVAPRMTQLKERYGDDKQKLNVAMMELYKKEKINPAAGCLPILVQMPIFLSLYWVLVESVELRQAPWFAWIQDLTARDPYFILPALNMLVMFLTQKLTPAPGMDPMQQRMMQFMPLVFGVMMAFFPSGLVLYWVTNGALGLLQQWWNTKQYGGVATTAKPSKAK